MTQLSPSQWLDILAFHHEAGVDIAIGETPINHFAANETAQARAIPDEEDIAGDHPARRPALSHKTPSPPRGPVVSTPAPDEAVMAAREAARSAESLDALRAMLDAFDGCALKRTASRLVFAAGNPQARVMFVGEAPGRDEDQQGEPFVGRAGRLLDRMMAAIGLDRTSAYIANIIPWRPPGNRTPTPQETAICLPFISRQIELADPDVLVCLGGQAAQALFSTTEGITRLRGHFRDYETGTRTIKALATFHPAYLLRTPIGKRLAWRDMLAIEAMLEKK